MKVGINGFGRIGKTVYKELIKRNITVSHINDPFVTKDYIAYLLKYDSTYTTKESYNLDFKLTTHKAPADINWDADIIVEATGIFKNLGDCEIHLKQGAKKVIVTAPSDAPMFVYGVNHLSYNNESVISNASCTTNCLAPICDILHTNFEIKEGLMTTIHAVTASQKTLDSVAKDFRSGRGAMQNIIPASTGAAKAVTKVLPMLEGRITGMAMRVPVANVSVVDFTFRTGKETSLKEIVGVMKKSAEEKYKGVLGVTEEMVVSSDFNGCSMSGVLDVDACIELNSQFFKVIAWYDNEYGYSCRVADMVEYIGSKL